jgi:hypothetical protein
MDHNEAVRQKATEKYLLNELDPTLRDQFEEHLFDCTECALDLRAAALFVEHSKTALAEPHTGAPSPAAVPATAKPGMLAWLRPAFALPLLATLLAVISYQNLVTYPLLKQAAAIPQIAPWASIHVSTRGASTTHISVHPGEVFHLLVNIPPENSFASYTLSLSSPSGRLQWTRTVAATAADDTRSVYVPGTSQESGTYTLAVKGTTATGEDTNLGSYSIEVQVQK